MRSTRKIAAFLCMLAAIICLSVFPVQAASVTKATDNKKLTNVKKAQKVAGEWVKKGKKYYLQLEDGSADLADQWVRVDGKVYYINKSGYRTKGWVQYNNSKYYMQDDGTLTTGWLKLNKKTYYFKANGKMAVGKYKVKDGKTYYFDKKTGEMKKGWVKIGKYEYYFGKVKGKLNSLRWVRQSGKYYYLDKNGRKITKEGWLQVGKKKYYLDSKGARVTGTLYIGNKGYYFKKDGVYDPSVKVKPEVDPTKKMVALTFDDGPGPYTDRLLNCLQKNGAKATFFMVGSNVPRYKNTVKRMAQMKCELGSHSYSHPAFTTISAAERASQVSRTKNNIYAACGQYPTVFRLPYGDGHSSPYVLNSLGLPSIYWSIDTRDWANTGNPQHTINEVLNTVRNGSIILMHDIHYSSVVAAETIIPALKARGYQLVTVSQLAKYKGKTTLKAGKTYYNFW